MHPFRDHYLNHFLPLSPLLYSSLQTYNFQYLSSLTSIRFSPRSTLLPSFTHEMMPFVATGSDPYRNGVLAGGVIAVANSEDAKGFVKLGKYINFQREISLMDIWTSGQTKFVAVVMNGSSDIIIHDIDCLDNGNNQKDLSKDKYFNKNFGKDRNFEVNQWQKIQVNPRVRFSHPSLSSKITHLKTTSSGFLCSTESTIFLFALSSSSSPSTFAYHRSKITSISVMNQNVFFSGDEDQQIFMWDNRVGKPSGKFIGGSVVEWLNGQMVVTAGSKGIKLYDTRHLATALMKEPTQHSVSTLQRYYPTKSQFSSPFPTPTEHFLSTSPNGIIELFHNKSEFVHLGHQNQVKGVDCRKGVFVSVEKGDASIMVWRPGTLQRDE